MTTTDTLENVIKQGATAIGVLENGEVLSLPADERPGVLLTFGRSGTGKSVALENIIISDMYNGRGGLFIDPYGDLLQDIQAYIPADKTDKVIIFEARGARVEENVARFNNEVDLEKMQQDASILLFCKLDYSTLGIDGARTLGLYITKQFLSIVGGKDRTIVLDEAHNFIDMEILEAAKKSKATGLSFIFANQMGLNYRADMLDILIKNMDHAICYRMDTATAKLMNKNNPDLITEQLISSEVHHFYTKLNIQSDSPTTTKARGIFPIPFPKNI